MNNYTTVKYVRTDGNDANTGNSIADAYLTIQKALEESGTVGKIIVGSGSYAEDIDCTAVVGTEFVFVECAKDTDITFNSYLTDSVIVHWKNGVSELNSTTVNADKKAIFDNQNITIKSDAEYSFVFYHCNTIIDKILRHHVFVSCAVRYNNIEDFLRKSSYMFYGCTLENIPENYLHVKVPLIDIGGREDFFSAIAKYAKAKYPFAGAGIVCLADEDALFVLDEDGYAITE